MEYTIIFEDPVALNIKRFFTTLKGLLYANFGEHWIIWVGGVALGNDIFDLWHFR